MQSISQSQRTEYFSGAELAGLVRSAASFALARAVTGAADAGVVMDYDFFAALGEVKPALGKQVSHRPRVSKSCVTP